MVKGSIKSNQLSSVMKKTSLLFLLSILLTGCFGGSTAPNYNHPHVAFTKEKGFASRNPFFGKTVVVGKELSLELSVYMDGMEKNPDKEMIDYKIDKSLLQGTPYHLMPKKYYELSNPNQFVIPAEKKVGKITISVNKNFLQDSKATKPYYAIPFILTEKKASEFSILKSQQAKVVVVKYESVYAGKYQVTGTFTTYNEFGDEINSGKIDKMTQLTTLSADCLKTSGLINQSGKNGTLSIKKSNDDISVGFIPNKDAAQPEPKNIAITAEPKVTTSYIDPYGKDDLRGLNDGKLPDKPNSYIYRYNNWPKGDDQYQWIEYEFSQPVKILKSKYWWGSDGAGSQQPTDSYVKYYDKKADKFIKVPNLEPTYKLQQFNTVGFNTPFLTTKIRTYMIAGREHQGGSSQGTIVYEWQVIGIVPPSAPEAQEITSIENTNKTNTYNKNTNTFTLHYKVNFVNGNYTLVSSKLTLDK